MDWDRFAGFALHSLTIFSGCPHYVASRAYQVKGIPVELCHAVLGVLRRRLEKVCKPFLNVLPTDDGSVRRKKNRIARVKRGKGGGIEVVVCLRSRLTHCDELLDRLWIGQVFLLGVSRQSKADCQTYEGNYQAFFHYLLPRGLVVQRSAAGFLTSPGTSVSPMAERTAPLVRGRWATKTLDSFSRSKSMKELPVPYWSRV